MKASIRKIVTILDETHSEMGQSVAPAIRRVAAVAVIANPFAGRYAEDLAELIEIGAELGGLLAAEAIAGQAERFDLFTRLRHKPFPGGDLLRTAALVLGMLAYRLRDLV